MIISFLAIFALSESIVLTDDNFNDVINNTEKIPVFLKLWANWCPHCKEMAPEWTKLVENNEFQGKIYFAEIECEQYRHLCKRFEGENYPRIYYLDLKENSSTRYLGEREYDNFKVFIKKQIQFPLVSITENDLQYYRDLANTTTSFIFCFPDNDVDSLHKAQEIVIKRRHYESQFLIMNSEVKKIIAITSPNRTVEFIGSFDDPKINLFLITNSVPFLNEYTAAVMKHSEFVNTGVFILMHNHSQTPTQESIEICEDASKYFPVTYADCINQDWLCRYTSIDVNTTQPEFIVFDRKNRKFFVYRSTDRQVDSVKKWNELVFHKKAKSEGPGTGLIGQFLEPIYDQKAGGDKVNYMPFFALPLIFVVVIGMFIYDCLHEIGHQNSHKSHHKSYHRNDEKKNE
ncbi:Thioredoxin family protein [Tritrichomonas foetus]|uniref:Thioredoxin family protein n=1 Tax=Tritrichomonas foetus TaxID=1144522 RepID=A0A1J4L2J1_9EUKA|nr:Thioredoxin family protein [Tritrichomonas foetus]|eukprot:OHT16109.1 Thioredoxin family protein [Tritrichomonas foetus]